MRLKTGLATYVRDSILFVLGIIIILKQAGVLFPEPSDGPSLELLAIGALFCNGPLFLQYLSIRRGTSGSSEQVAPSVPASPSAPPSGPSGADQ